MQVPLRVLSSLEDKDALSSGYKEGMFHMRVYDLFQERRGAKRSSDLVSAIYSNSFSFEIFSMPWHHILG